MMADIVRAAGMLVYRHKAGQIEYLLLQASYSPYHWSPPKGHVNPGEDEWSAALRETFEEAGIAADNLDIHMDFMKVMKYVVRKSDRYGEEVNKQVRNFLSLILLWGTFIIHFFYGHSSIFTSFQKTVKYWLAKLKDDKEIRLSDEHKDGRWLSVDEAVVLAQYKEMQDLIRKAQEYLIHKK
uniref:Bis(5'-nucleosyl)-tetraphosphatase [asymmetrical] n=1 Tax=Elaeophora elaphi TaxID=1147741 RepID=A0A0R3S4V9_9BILA